MNVSINDLPPSVLLKIYQASDESSRQASLRVSKAWNVSSKCYEMIHEHLKYIPAQIQLIKAGDYFIAALGDIPKKLTKLFYFHLKNELLIPIKINDDRITILNIFSTANRLLIQFKRGIKLFRCDEHIEKIQEIKVKKNETSIRVETLNDDFFVIQTFSEKTSEIAVFNNKSGALVDCFPSTGISKIKNIDGILVISQKNLIVRYSLTERKILEKIYFQPGSNVLDAQVINGTLSALIEDKDQKSLKVHNFII